MELVLMAALVICVTISAVGLQLRWAKRFGLFDLPKSHSLHEGKVSTGGGAGLLLGAILGVFTASILFGDTSMRSPMLPLGLIALISLIDDYRSQPILLRLAIHFLAASLMLYLGHSDLQIPMIGLVEIHGSFVACGLSLLWIVLVTNLYNFMDGIDGFAALQGVVSFGVLALVTHDPLVRVWAVCLGVACAAFLFFNWMPAKVFMGDVGAISIGFCLASLPFNDSTDRDGITLLIVVLSLWFFLYDGISTILLRCFRGEKPWKSHTSHLYQLWVKAGSSHQEVCLRILGITLGMLFLFALVQGTENELYGLGTLFVVSIIIFIGLSLKVRKRS